MKIWLVTVRPPVATGGRYFDSIWVRKTNAEERADQLKQELKRSGFKVWFSQNVTELEWYITITEAHANDGQLADEKVTP